VSAWPELVPPPAPWLGAGGDRVAGQLLHALQPHRAGSVYVNFLDSDDDPSRVREAYGDHIYRRLAEVKAKYDPDNAFHHNKNIRPG
jgi:FAD/FMN-containing dehydrogenase